MKKKKKDMTTVILLVLLLAGLSLLLYPAFSDYWNSFRQTRAITTYAADVAKLETPEYDRYWTAAQDYNRSLAARGSAYTLTDAQKAEYESALNISGQGVMGYVEIPKIDCSLPVYHGTEEGVLQTAIGHIEWSSLPVGGENTHCVLSGHRGLPSAKLFTNLDRLNTGDVFMLQVLDEVLTYEVDQILIVEPEDVSALQIEAGKDLCTLVTCTPYGINSHRLLVRGHRVDTAAEKKALRVTADAVQIEPMMVAPIVALPMLLLLLGAVLLPKRRSGKPYKAGDQNEEDFI